MGIKAIGPKAAEEVVRHRPYTSLEDFVAHVEGRRLHKNIMKTFILAGLFDSFNPNRFELLRQYNYDIRGFKPDDCQTFFDLDKNEIVDERPPRSYVDCSDPSQWNDTILHKLNLYYYGFILSGHPAEALPNHYWSAQEYDRPFYISGILVRLIPFKDKMGRDMARVVLDTPFGECAVYVFARAWDRYSRLFHLAMQAPSLTGRLLTLKVSRQKFMNNDTVILINAYPAEEGKAIWQSYLQDCLIPAVSSYSRYRFYA